MGSMKRAALFVGVNDYVSPITSLAYARRDATTLYDFFLRSPSYRTDLVDVIAVEATDKKIVDKVMAMMDALDPGDLFLFYFSGHSVEDHGQHLLLGEDARQFGEYWVGTLSLNQLKAMTRKRGVQSVFIIDSCRDAVFEGHRGVGTGAESHARSVSLAPLKSEKDVDGFLPPVVLCSCSAGEQAFEVPSLQQGVFSKAFLEVLSSASDFSIDAIASAMLPKIQDLLHRHNLAGKQTPELYKPLSCTAALFDAPKPKSSPTLSHSLSTLILAAERGDPECQVQLGEHYANGEGVTRDPEQAFRWYQKAADQGHAKAQYYLGCYYMDDTYKSLEFQKALVWFTKAAEQGHIVAQFNLASYYEKGRGVQRDYAEAAKWYTKAAEQGDMLAQFSLASYYAKGRGVAQDYVAAIKWCQKAAAQGHAPAQYNLGVCYERGITVPQDNEMARQWYQKAADQGHELAKVRLK